MSVPSLRDRLLARLSPGEGPLRVGGILAADLARRHGTPTYVYDAAILRAQFAAVRQALGPGVGILYALKANPSIAVARVLRAAGAGAELASAGELHVATAAGFAGAEMQFAGPGKSDDDLRVALTCGVGAINLESEAEYERLTALAGELGVVPSVALRVNPARTPTGSRVRMGGGSKKFGVDEDAVPSLAHRVVREGHCDLRGLHVYTGSQNSSASAWLDTATDLITLASRVEAATGAPIRSLNFGGGFAVPTFDADAGFDLAAAGTGLRALLAQAPPERQHYVELGRYLTAEAGVYLTRVLHTKTSGGRTHAIVDGGMHHFGAAAGLGAVIPRPYPIVSCATPLAPVADEVAVGGPLCTPADEFHAGATLPALHAGDLLAVLLAGAYGLTFSPLSFLGHPTPAEVLVDDGHDHLVRRRGRPEDSLRDQISSR